LNSEPNVFIPKHLVKQKKNQRWRYKFSKGIKRAKLVLGRKGLMRKNVKILFEKKNCRNKNPCSYFSHFIFGSIFFRTTKLTNTGLPFGPLKDKVG